MDDKKQENDNQPPEIGADASSNEKIDRPSTEVKSITNIYYDCLKRIYDFLDLESLLNVAGTCKRLQIAAAAYFGDVYGEKGVSFCVGYMYLDCFGKLSCLEPGIELNENDIEVNSLKFFLPFLRCFGAKISDLTAYHHFRKKCRNENDYLDQYINQFCTKTLKSISFCRQWKLSIGNFPNPFECVEDVCIEDADLEGQLLYFRYLFPKLRKLVLSRVSVDENYANIQFSNLKELSIWIGPQTSFTVKGLQTLLHANPQLQNFKLYFDLGQEMAWNELLNTIKGNSSITKLTIQNGNINRYISQTDLMRFANDFPSIVELHFWKHRIAPQDAIIFISQLKSLKKFRFLINDETEYNELVSQLDSEWKHEYRVYVRIRINAHEITLTR